MLSELEVRSEVLVIARDGRAFRAPGGERVDLDRRHALRLILIRLAEERVERPGSALDVAALLDAGWPGERVIPEAGAARVYVAVSTLRRMGLRPVLVRRDDGYLIDPDTETLF